MDHLPKSVQITALVGPGQPSRYSDEAMGWLPEKSKFDSRKGKKFFSPPECEEGHWAPPSPPIQWITAALSVLVKRPERATAHTPPYNAEV
jgi:hypothetical protein